jgi:hypothetical protein
MKHVRRAVPAKAGTYRSTARAIEKRTPAFAGKGGIVFTLTTLRFVLSLESGGQEPVLV